MPFDTSPQIEMPVREAAPRGSLSRRAVLIGIPLAALVIPILIVSRGDTFASDPELGRLLLAMAGIKALFVLAAIGAMVWRAGMEMRNVSLASYAGAGAAMGLGLGLMMQLAQPGLAAILLHAGFAATLVLLFRDRRIAQALREKLAARA